MAHKNKGIQVVIVPFHGHAHLNPMLQLAKRLAWRGVDVTIATTTTVIRQMSPSAVSTWESITLESIYNDSDPNMVKQNALHFLPSFEAEAASKLGQILVTKKALSKRCLLVYHVSLSWARAVAHRNNVFAAAFSSFANAAFISYYCLYLKSEGKAVEPELPAVLPPPELILEKAPSQYLLTKPDDIDAATPWFHPVVRSIIDRVVDTVNADLLLVNSFDAVEKEAVEWMSNIWKVKTIGPSTPSVYLDNRLENDVVYGFNNTSPEGGDCIKWLDTKPTGSVIYIAFGSIAKMSAAQMVEMAEALKQRACSFLWVIRETDQANLPDNFISEMLSSGKGLVVEWSPQMEVMAHSAVGCYVSHCGWTSVHEALSFGIPILGMPQFFDQLVDAYLVGQVWGVGIIAPTTNEDGLVTHEEIGRCLEEIMSGPRGRTIKEKAAMWRNLAKEALDEGGSSDKHVDEIIEWLASS